MAAIEKAENLSPIQKRHWLTSLRQMARYLDRPLIPTRIAAIAEAVKKLHPARLGVGPETFINHRANARAGFSGATDNSQILDGKRLWTLVTGHSCSRSRTLMPRT